MPDVAHHTEPRLADAERLLSDNTIRVSTPKLTHLLKCYRYLNLQMGRDINEILVLIM
jgi:hypothetical protein